MFRQFYFNKIFFSDDKILPDKFVFQGKFKMPIFFNEYFSQKITHSFFSFLKHDIFSFMTKC